MNLTQTIDALIRREGGYSADPVDRGGETIYGITKATARAFGYQGAMIDMPRTTAFLIYVERFWTQPRLDGVALIDETLAEELLDTGVNMGPVWAGRFLQRALNSLNLNGKAWPDLGVDGAIGKMTLYALGELVRQRGADGRRVITGMCNAQQSVRYLELSEADPTQERFSFGWQRSRAFPGA